MATGDLIKLGTLYFGGVKKKRPINPVLGGYGGDIPTPIYGETLEIRNTDLNEAYKLYWREVNDNGKKYLVCDRVIATVVRIDNLNYQSLVSGKTITIDGNSYRLRFLTGGASSGSTHKNNEWDRWIVNEANISGLPKPTNLDLTNNSTKPNSTHNNFWNWWSVYTLTQEREQYNSNMNSRRGNTSANAWSSQAINVATSESGWRPVLEVLNTAPTIKAPIPPQSIKKNTSATLNLANYFSDAEGDPLTYTATSSNTNIATAAVLGNTLTLTGKTIGSVTITVTANDGKLTVSQSFTLNVTNTAPTITVSSPANNMTLYENDVFGIAGNVTDIDVGNVVSVKYSVDGGAPQAITAIVSNGSASSFAKNLTYKNGALYDGATAITGQLAEGSQHTLNIWAEDDKGGKSPEIIRTFYVVPNRAASLTLDAFITRTGLINTDVVNVSGAVADLDNGNVIVKYKIGNGAFVQVYNGQASSTPTPFNFNILLADLADGANQITIQAVDAYNAITQQVLSLSKTANEQPLLTAVTYYEITPPNGATDGLQLYVERELGDLVVSADVYMGASGETEVFVPMTLASTANLTNGNVEDTFSYQHTGDASKVVIRINMSRSSAATNKAIKKISGVLT